jgi:DNA-binding CsgD family transcriptional regulator
VRLSHRDHKALDQAIFELHECRDLNHFRKEVSAIILKLVPCDYFSITEYQINPAAPRQILTDFVESNACITPELARQMGDKIMLHPFTEYFLKGGAPTALKISDFLTKTQYCSSPIYETQQLWGFSYCMAIPLDAVPGKAAAFAVNDRKKDFTERDRLVLNLLQRHFDQALRNARQTTIRLTRADKPLAAYELTCREAQIGHWVARGKTNTEIALILGCRPRTIEKHMERVLEKLEVENRVAAAVMLARAEELSLR